MFVFLLFLLGVGRGKDDNEEGGGATGSNWGHQAIGGAIAASVAAGEGGALVGETVDQCMCHCLEFGEWV